MNRVSTRYRYILLIALISVILLTVGCAKKAEPVPTQPEMGVLNMMKVVKAHPQYVLVEKLQAERSSLLALLAQQEGQVTLENQQVGLNIADLAKSTDQEFQTKMAGKQSELNHQLQAQSEAKRRQLTEQVDAYIRELDIGYQNRNFALQVKLKTVDLNKEEQAAIQKQMDELQSERMGKIVARQQDLTVKMTDSMQQAEQTAAKELEAYGKTLQSELSADMAKKAQAMKTLPGNVLTPSSNSSSIQAKLASNESALAKLQQDIIADVKKSAATVATSRGLETVLADVEIFTSAATDITADVIAGSKK